MYMKILYVNDTNAQHFDNENKKHPVFAKYFSPTCPACIAMESEWDDMCKDIDKKYNTDMIMAQIDPQGMNKLENMKTHSDVAYVPTIMILKNGQKVKEYEGEKQKNWRANMEWDKVGQMWIRQTQMKRNRLLNILKWNPTQFHGPESLNKKGKAIIDNIRDLDYALKIYQEDPRANTKTGPAAGKTGVGL